VANASKRRRFQEFWRKHKYKGEPAAAAVPEPKPAESANRSSELSAMGEAFRRAMKEH
jgi:hypothetical protein